MTIQPGELWRTTIPFTDQSGAKIRPALILWLDGQDVVVAPITSTASRTRTDVALSDWQGAGLRAPSTVRLSRILCLKQSLLRTRLGRISQADARRVKDIWAKHIKPQF